MELAPVQILPPTSSEDRFHVLDETCWCKPTLTDVDGGIELRHH